MKSLPEEAAAFGFKLTVKPSPNPSGAEVGRVDSSYIAQSENKPRVNFECSRASAIYLADLG